jgi:hypothetical protein
MKEIQVEVQGTVQPDGTLVLDQKLQLPAGRVKVVVQPVYDSAPPQESLVEFVDRVRREAEARGHQYMTDEELHAWIEELREDDDRIERAYQEMEEYQRRQDQQG